MHEESTICKDGYWFYYRNPEQGYDVTNPYPVGTSEHIDWFNGFDWAYHEQDRFKLTLSLTPSALEMFSGGRGK